MEWQVDQCFELLFTSPYDDPDVYYSFTDDLEPICTSATDGFTVECYKKAGTTDTLVFYFPAIDMDRRDRTSMSFSFTNFHTPWSSRDIDGIDLRTYTTKECDSSFQGSPVATVTVIGEEIDEEDCEVTSSSKVLGDQSPSNTMEFTFIPKTFMSKSGSGMLRLHLPDWYKVGEKAQFMYNAKVENACESDQMKITSSKPEPLDGLIRMTYKDMDEKYFEGKPITIKCRNFYNPIYQKVWKGFTISTYDDELFPALIEKSESVGFDATDYEPADIANSQFRLSPAALEIGTMSTW